MRFPRIAEFLFFGIFSLALGQTLTLEDCIRLAITQNAQVIAATYELGAAKAQRYQAVTALLPSANLSAAYTRLDEAPYTVFNPSEFPFPMPDTEPMRIEMGKAEMEKIELQLVQPLNLQLFTALSLANIGVQQGELSLQKSRLNSALNAQKAYFQLLQAKTFLQIADISREQINAHIRDLQNMFEQGIVHKKDLLRAQVQGSEAELLILQAKNAVELAHSALCLAIAIPQDSSIDVAESLAFEEYPLTLDSALYYAQKNALDMRMLNVGIEASQKQVNLAWQAMLPSFAAMFNYDYEKPNRELLNEWYSHWTAVGVIQWDIFNWGGNVAKIRQAKEKKRQMEFSKKAAVEGIELKTRSAYLTMKERQEKIKIAEKELETAEENYRVTSDMFRAGAATNAELLDAHADLTRAKINRITYLADYNIARAELESITGQLEEKINNILKKQER